MRICMLAEGCYPYVAGGVSSWIQMLIQGMPEHEFVIYSIAADSSLKGKFQYELPENVIEIKEIFLDDMADGNNKRITEYQLSNIEKDELVNLITGNETDWNVLIDMFAYPAIYKAGKFLSCDGLMEGAIEAAKVKYEYVPLREIFWMVRSMLYPIMKILSVKPPKADIYHSVSTGYAGMMASAFAKRNHKPFILTEHGIYTREREEEIIKASWTAPYFKNAWIGLFNGMAKYAYDRANTIVSLYDGARKLQIECGANSKKCVVISNGIHINKFLECKNPKTQTMTRRKEIRGESSLILGSIMRVVPIKDIKTMILAFYFVKKQVPDSKFYLVGPTNENPKYYTECLNLIRRLSLKDITFVGKSDVIDWYDAFDICLLGSISEGQPFALMEAMAAGCPVIATNVGACMEMLRDINNLDNDELSSGIVVPAMSPKIMAETILRLHGDKKLREVMGENGRIKATKSYKIEDFILGYLKLYSEVM